MFDFAGEWGLGDDAIVLRCSTQQEARNIVEDQERYFQLAKLAAVFTKPKARVVYPGAKTAQGWKNCKGYEILASGNSIAPEPIEEPYIHIRLELPISDGILRARELINENPAERYFLHKISPDGNKQIQIAATEATRDLIIGATPAQSIGRNRSSFWLPADLADFTREVRQRLSEGSSFTYQWRGFSPVTKKNWRRFTSTYTCIEVLADGSIIQLAQPKEVVSIDRPREAMRR